MTFAQCIEKLADRRSLSRSEMREAMGELMAGRATPVQIAAFLSALRVKEESVDEIAGAAEAMRAAALRVLSEAPLLVDTCGTGGDAQGSFNVSTAAALVVAGAGIAVAKHGNRSISSRCGSADVLERSGIPVESTPELAQEALKRIGLAFLFSPSFHPAMKHAMPVRRELGFRTIFNLLGPLTNPARPHVQLIGVYGARWVRPIAEVLLQLGCRDGLVVHGQGHDEIVLSGPTQAAILRNGRLEMETLRPEDFGLSTRAQERLQGGSPEQNAKILQQLLDGAPSPFREAACMNAAALLRAAWGSAPGGRRRLTLKETYKIAEASIDSRAARGKWEALKALLQDAARSSGR